MITKYINTNYEYPIHIYFDNAQIDNILKSTIVRENEIHAYYTNSRIGSCNYIDCNNCPIFKECGNNSNLYHLIPDNIKNEYPELFI